MIALVFTVVAVVARQLIHQRYVGCSNDHFQGSLGIQGDRDRSLGGAGLTLDIDERMDINSLRLILHTLC